MYFVTKNPDGSIFRCAPLTGPATTADLGLRGERTLEVVADDAPEVMAHQEAQEAAEAERLAAEAEAARQAEEVSRAEAKRAEEAAAAAEALRQEREAAAARIEEAAAIVQAAVEAGKLDTPEVAAAYATIALAGAARLRA